jgi:hypothetical protein
MDDDIARLRDAEMRLPCDICLAWQLLQRVERDQMEEKEYMRKKLERKAATEQAFSKSVWHRRYKGHVHEKYIPPMAYRPVLSFAALCGEEL